MTDPFVGSLTFVRIYSGVLASRRPSVLNSVKDKQGARRPHAADACQPPRGHQGSPRRRHRRAGRPEGHHHRRHARAIRHTPIVLERMEFPEPVIEVAVEPKTKADQEKMGVALQPPGARRIRRSASRTDHEIRPDHHQGHGRAPPRDHRRPHEARVQGRGQRRRAAGGVSRDHQPRRSRSTTRTRSRPAVPASSRKVKLALRAAASRAPASCSRTTSSAAPCRRNTSRASRRA